MTRRVVLTVIGTALLIVQSGCKDSTGPDSDAISARARWETHAPAAYSYTVSRACFCPVEAVGPITVTVRNGVVESRRYAATGAEVPQQYAHLFPTVEGLFAQVDSARANHVASLNVTYDKIYGYPTLINVDVNVQWADDEYAYTASNLLAR